jgi:hypothetical protein
MLKIPVVTLLLAHSMATMAQTVSGNVFCAGTTFDPAPASVSISGTVAALMSACPAPFGSVLKTHLPPVTRGLFDTWWLGGLDDRRLPHLR